MTNQLKGKIRNWVNFQRDILSLYHDKAITRHEYLVYLHLRLSCNPYGTATTSINDINNDIFGGKVSNNYVNKILLSLRSKKLIWYKDRQGVRGSFEVQFGDFILPTEQIKTLGKYFEPQQVTSDSQSETIVKSEPTPQVNNVSQRLNVLKSELNKSFSMPKQNYQVRGYNNDTDTQNKNKTYDKSELKTFDNFGNRNLLTDYFCPRNSDEEIAWKIAKDLDEKDMRFVISRLNKYGLHVIEKAWIDTKEGYQKGLVRNKGSYFNARVEKLAKGG